MTSRWGSWDFLLGIMGVGVVVLRSPPHPLGFSGPVVLCGISISRQLVFRGLSVCHSRRPGGVVSWWVHRRSLRILAAHCFLVPVCGCLPGWCGTPPPPAPPTVSCPRTVFPPSADAVPCVSYVILFTLFNSLTHKGWERKNSHPSRYHTVGIVQ